MNRLKSIAVALVMAAAVSLAAMAPQPAMAADQAPVAENHNLAVTIFLGIATAAASFYTGPFTLMTIAWPGAVATLTSATTIPQFAGPDRPGRT